MPTKDMFPVEVVALRFFQRDMKRLKKKYPRVGTDLEPLTKDLQRGQTPGDQIPSSNYMVYKVRAKNSDANKGKSGGYRVIYRMANAQLCHLVTIYSKTEQPDISPQQIDAIIADWEE